MVQYISKSAVVVEIERRITAYQKNFDKADNKIARLSTDGRMQSLKELLSFLDTLEVEVDSESIDEKAINKYLYEKKGYPIDLNGNLLSFEETMKDIEKYNKYKEDKFIEKAEKWLNEHILDYVYAKEWGQGVGVEGELFEDFKKYMKGE